METGWTTIKRGKRRREQPSFTLQSDASDEISVETLLERYNSCRAEFVEQYSQINPINLPTKRLTVLCLGLGSFQADRSRSIALNQLSFLDCLIADSDSVKLTLIDPVFTKVDISFLQAATKYEVFASSESVSVSEPDLIYAPHVDLPVLLPYMNGWPSLRLYIGNNLDPFISGPLSSILEERIVNEAKLFTTTRMALPFPSFEHTKWERSFNDLCIYRLKELNPD
jgi:hypothetical protein